MLSQLDFDNLKTGFGQIYILYSDKDGFELTSQWFSTAWAIKKGATFIFTITLANVDRFQ